MEGMQANSWFGCSRGYFHIIRAVTWNGYKQLVAAFKYPFRNRTSAFLLLVRPPVAGAERKKTDQLEFGVINMEIRKRGGSALWDRRRRRRLFNLWRYCGHCFWHDLIHRHWTAWSDHRRRRVLNEDIRDG